MKELEISKREQLRLEKEALKVVGILRKQKIPEELIQYVIRTMLDDAMVKFTYEFCIKLEHRYYQKG